MTPKELRQRRLSLGWSISDVAKRVGVPDAVVAQWEDGTAPISTPSAVEQILGELERAGPGPSKTLASSDKIQRGDFSGRKNH
jgi:predicted transcriptional regulator